jgi:hypothetical protein
MNFAIRLYRALARVFPHEFQMAYGTEVIQRQEADGGESARYCGILSIRR